MSYRPKPIAVRSENLVTSVKASDGWLCIADGMSKLSFGIPAMDVGYRLDAAVTRSNFNYRILEHEYGCDFDYGVLVHVLRKPSSIHHKQVSIVQFEPAFSRGNICMMEKTRQFFKECQNMEV